MSYEPVIGLEVHVELNSKSKMFCRCSADYFGNPPNTHTCPVCLGLPGALPFINQEAIKKCIQIGLALNCSINDKSYFERKNYFYPDLAKGFQISQMVLPIAIRGEISVTKSKGEKKKIQINRVHQEEDTGKLTHLDSETYIDFNRSGVPLVEVVTEPDFRDVEEIKDYARQLQVIFKNLNVSNADMERGDMRLEANISVRPVGETQLPNYRVELKNINSFRFMVQAVEYEIKRQIGALDKGEKLRQETRGWDENNKKTYVQRSKEEAHDYRYFPEPDLPELHLEKIKKEASAGLPKESVVPSERVEVYKSMGVTYNSAATIAYSPFKSAVFAGTIDMAQRENISLATVANEIANRGFGVADINSASKHSEEVIKGIKSKITNIISDEAELEILAKEAIDENPNLVESYKAGKLTVLQALIGVVMRKTQGKADVGQLIGILKKLLD